MCCRHGWWCCRNDNCHVQHGLIRCCCHYRFYLDFFHGHGHEAAGASRPGDLADGEHEAFYHGHGNRDDDHLVRLESCMHTPYLARHYRRKLVGSLPRGMPKVVDCW